MAVNSRKVEDLLPTTQKKWYAFEKAFQEKYPEADIFFSSGYRDEAYQNGLFAIGRTKAGQPCRCGGRVRKIGTCKTHPMGLPVTNARGGESDHQYRIAVDMAILVNKQLTWDEKWFTRAGEMAEKYGFRWSGRWKGSLRETAHIADADFVVNRKTKTLEKVK